MMLEQLDIATATVKSLQLCLILCDPIDGSPPGSPVPGILQARKLEWVAMLSSRGSSSRGSSQPRGLNCVFCGSALQADSLLLTQGSPKSHVVKMEWNCQQDSTSQIYF